MRPRCINNLTGVAVDGRALVLVGVQTAFFVPAKYGILPEILPHDELSAGNGLLEMTSNLAMLAGIVGGSGLFSVKSTVDPWLAAMILAGLSASSAWLASLTIPRRARPQPREAWARRFDWRRSRSGPIGCYGCTDRPGLRLDDRHPGPAAVLAYDATHWGWRLAGGFPLAALGIGVGLGCLLAGRLSGAKVEYGLLPLGCARTDLSTLAFAAIGPGLFGTIVLMTLLGIFSGLLFVPLNALLQWRSPADRRGAVIAMANVLVYGGMVLGTFWPWCWPGRFRGRGTFSVRRSCWAAVSCGRFRSCPMPSCGSS